MNITLVASLSSDVHPLKDCHSVLQVDMQTTGEVTCPIALGPPVAPQITPCGHVFSFPAIVQHLVSCAEASCGLAAHSAYKACMRPPVCQISGPIDSDMHLPYRSAATSVLYRHTQHITFHIR